MQYRLVALAKALLISLALIALADYFNLPIFSEAGGLQAQDSDMKAAQTSTEAWLSLIDKQSYAASWDAAATGFKDRSHNF